MAIVTMQKVAVIAPHSLRETLLDRLQKEGVMQISHDEDPTAVDHADVNFRAAELEYAITTLTDSAPKDVLADARRIVSAEKIVQSAASCDVRGIVDELQALEAEDTEQTRKQNELQTQALTLQPWSSFSRTLQSEKSSATTVQMFGIVPDQNAEELLMILPEKMPRCVVESFPSTNNTTLLCATLWTDDARLFEEIATTHGWTTVNPPSIAGTAQEGIQLIQTEQQSIQTQMLRRSARRVSLASALPSLMRTRTFLGWLQSKQKVREASVESHSTIILTGWTPKKGAAALQDTLNRDVGSAVVVLRVKPEADDEAPVLIKNSRFVTPFESVTTLYGLPLSSEMDPTASLSPFFAFFFALCLTDAGYGMTIATIFGVWLFVTKKTIEEARLPWLLFMSGILSFLVGIPFGGWFGLSASALPQALSFMTVAGADGIHFRGQIWDLNTQTGINFLQNLSLVLGMTHLFFGMFLAGWHKWVHGSRAQAFWEHFTSHVLLGCVLVYVFAPEEWAMQATYLLYISIALIIWGKGYGSAWYLRPIFGVLGVMNAAIGLLSNGLSYLRILALGLVTGAMAMAVNQVAIEMSKLFPIWLGIPVMLLIAIGGHTVSIALNALGSFIHAGRLQFIEFFGQFFEGGGKPFSPFSRSISS